MNYIQAAAPFVGAIRSINPVGTNLLVAVGLGAYGKYWFDEMVGSVQRDRARLDLAQSILKQYEEKLGSYGCTIDLDNSKTTESSTKECLSRVQAMQQAKETGEAVVHQFNQESLGSLSLTDSPMTAVVKVSRYFASHQNSLIEVRSERDELRSFVHEANGNVKLLAQQSKEYNDNTQQTNAILRSCEHDKNAYFRMYEKEQEAKNTCLDDRIGLEQKERQCQQEKAAFTEEYIKLKKLYDRSWF